MRQGSKKATVSGVNEVSIKDNSQQHQQLTLDASSDNDWHELFTDCFVIAAALILHSFIQLTANNIRNNNKFLMIKTI